MNEDEGGSPRSLVTVVGAGGNSVSNGMAALDARGTSLLGPRSLFSSELSFTSLSSGKSLVEEGVTAGGSVMVQLEVPPAGEVAVSNGVELPLVTSLLP